MTATFNVDTIRLVDGDQAQIYIKFEKFLNELDTFKTDVDLKYNTIKTSAEISELANAAGYIDGRIDEFRLSNNGLVVGNGFGCKIFGAVNGRIQNTTASHGGTNDFDGVTSDLGTNADVYCHLPIMRPAYLRCEVTTDSPSGALPVQDVLYTMNTDTWLTIFLNSTSNRSVNVDVMLLGSTSDPIDLFGSPVLSLSATPPA